MGTAVSVTGVFPQPVKTFVAIESSVRGPERARLQLSIQSQGCSLCLLEKRHRPPPQRL